MASTIDATPDELLVQALQSRASRKHQDWTLGYYLKYLVKRAWWVIFRTRVNMLLIVLAVIIAGGYWLHTYLNRIQTYLTTTAPGVLAGKMPKGAVIKRIVSPRHVTYYVYKGVKVIFHQQFPRGLGLAHQSIINKAQEEISKIIYPWLVVILGVLVIIAILHEIISHRLLPAPSVYLTGVDRGIYKLHGTKLPTNKQGKTEAENWRIFKINKDTAGYTLGQLLSCATNYGPALATNVVYQNRFRKQPSFGSIYDEKTPLRPGWDILLPQELGEATKWVIGKKTTQGDEVVLEEQNIIEQRKITLRGESATRYIQTTNAATERSGPREPQPQGHEDNKEPTPPIYDAVVVEPKELPSSSAPTPIKETPRPRVIEHLAQRFALQPARIIEPPPEASFGLYAAFARQGEPIERVNLVKLFAEPARRIASHQIKCRPGQALAIHSALPGVLASAMMHLVENGEIAGIPHAWRHTASTFRLSDQEKQDLLLAVFAHDARYDHSAQAMAMPTTLSESPTQTLTQAPLPTPTTIEAEPEKLSVVVTPSLDVARLEELNISTEDDIESLIRCLPKDLPLIGIFPAPKHGLLCVFEVPITAASRDTDPYLMYLPRNADDALLYPTRTARLWCIDYRKLGDPTDPHYQVIRLPFIENGRQTNKLTGIVIKGGGCSFKGQVGNLQFWADALGKPKGDFIADDSSLINIHPNGVSLDLAEKIPVVFLHHTHSVNAYHRRGRGGQYEIFYGVKEIETTQLGRYALNDERKNLMPCNLSNKDLSTVRQVLDVFLNAKDTPTSELPLEKLVNTIAQVREGAERLTDSERKRKARAFKTLQQAWAILGEQGVGLSPKTIDSKHPPRMLRIGNISTFVL
jgi:hypothetical protein